MLSVGKLSELAATTDDGDDRDIDDVITCGCLFKFLTQHVRTECFDQFMMTGLISFPYNKSLARTYCRY